MTVQHTWPSDLAHANKGAGRGLIGDLLETKLPGAGRSYGRSWGDVPLRTVQWQVPELRPSTDKLRQLEAFLRHVDIRVSPFWLAEADYEVLNQRLDGLQCGTGDGTQTSFVLPITGSASDVGIFVRPPDGVGGALQISGYTIHSASNILSDSQAAMLDPGLADLVVVGTAAKHQETRVSADGLYSARIEPTGTQSNIGLRTTGYPATPGETWAGHSSVLSEGSFVVDLLWYDDQGGYLNATTSGALTGSDQAWQSISVSGTAPTLAAEVRVRARRTSSSSLPIWIDCLGLGRGSLPHWWLPSASPNVIDFDIAPADGSVVTAIATGRPIYYVKLDKDHHSNEMRDVGWASADKLSATEEVWVE